MLTIQLKVERETANPIKAVKRIDLGLRIDTLARLPRRTGGASFLLEREGGAHVAKTPVSSARLVKKLLLLGRMSLT